MDTKLRVSLHSSVPPNAPPSLPHSITTYLARSLNHSLTNSLTHSLFPPSLPPPTSRRHGPATCPYPARPGPARPPSLARLLSHFTSLPWPGLHLVPTVGACWAIEGWRRRPGRKAQAPMYALNRPGRGSPPAISRESEREIKYRHACWASLVSAFPNSISRLMMMLSCRGWAVMPASLYDPTRPWLYERPAYPSLRRRARLVLVPQRAITWSALAGST